MEESWNNKGFFIYNNFFENKYLNKILDNLSKINFGNTNNFGSKDAFLEFPSKYDFLNELTLHPKIISSCQKLLKTKDIRLIQSDVWMKTNTGRQLINSNQDQRIHMDYPNNYLTHPSIWNDPESVAIIIYFSDRDECGGETAVVPRKGDSDILYQRPYNKIAGLGKYKWFNDKTIVEKYFKEVDPTVYEWRKQLYDREIKVKYKKGTVLFYRHDLWHRGTPIKLNKTRIVMNLGFKKANKDYITCWNKGFARSLCETTNHFERLILKLNNDQRICLGFPDKKDKYWNNETKEQFKIRYSISRL